MQRVEEDGEWTLFSPDEVPDLHDLYGKAFVERYAYYEASAKRGDLRVTRTVRAAELWRRILTMLFETGHPWVTLQGPLQSALAAAAHRRRAFVEPVHGDHAEHDSARDRRLQSRFHQPWPIMLRKTALTPRASSAPSRPPCACSTT